MRSHGSNLRVAEILHIASPWRRANWILFTWRVDGAQNKNVLRVVEIILFIWRNKLEDRTTHIAHLLLKVYVLTNEVFVLCSEYKVRILGAGLLFWGKRYIWQFVMKNLRWRTYRSEVWSATFFPMKKTTDVPKEPQATILSWVRKPKYVKFAYLSEVMISWEEKNLMDKLKEPIYVGSGKRYFSESSTNLPPFQRVNHCSPSSWLKKEVKLLLM